MQIGNIQPGSHRDNPNQGRVYDIYSECPSLTGMTGGGRQPHVVVVKNEIHDSSDARSR